MRVVICHYHIYKNSGTSFDVMLEKNYGEKHICFDGPFPFFTIDQEQLARIIERKTNIVAFSSHQIQLPVPTSLDYLVLPVVFIRHPLLRVQSIYKFKRQLFDGTNTSKNAQKMSFNDWVSHCFMDRQEIVHISNAQTRILGAAYRQKPLIRRKGFLMEYDLQQATRNIATVQLLARTEFFNHDVGLFPEILSQYGIEFEFSTMRPKNTTHDNHHKTLDERLLLLEESVSDDNYKHLINANEQDLVLFDYVSKKFI